MNAGKFISNKQTLINQPAFFSICLKVSSVKHLQTFPRVSNCYEKHLSTIIILNVKKFAYLIKIVAEK